MTLATIHMPVLMDEVVAGLAPRPGEVAVDATLGAGGHALELLRRIAPGGGRLIGIDRDPEMLAIARQRLEAEAPAGSDWTLLLGDSGDLPRLLASVGVESFDLLLADCGLCSAHYDEAERGFSMKRPGPLDMRLDRSGPSPTAADVLNFADAETLWRVFKVYGEEPNAKRLAREVVRRREQAPFEGTEGFAELVRACYPAKHRYGRKTDPATRAFQGLRIFVNDELGSLARLLRSGLEMLSVGGRAAFISFHSHEDRLAKRSLRAASKETFASARQAMDGRGGVRALEIAKRVDPSAEEAEANPRSRSARLRICRKLAPLPANIEWPASPGEAFGEKLAARAKAAAAANGEAWK